MRPIRVDPEEEAGKCVWCGFCEFVCPTYLAVRERAYGPRGRLRIILASRNGNLTPAAFRALGTCLVCGACDEACPVGINISSAIWTAKAKLAMRVRGARRPRSELP